MVVLQANTPTIPVRLPVEHAVHAPLARTLLQVILLVHRVPPASSLLILGLLALLRVYRVPLARTLLLLLLLALLLVFHVPLARPLLLVLLRVQTVPLAGTL